MDNKLSKPVATVDVQRGRMDGNTFAVAWSSAGHALPDGPHFIYSQEYVSALTQRIAELEAKLATPKPPEKCPTCNRRYTLESYAHGECAICGDPFDANDALRSMGFTVEGDE